MKLSTKLLTTLSSIAVVGTIVPATVSCGCSKQDYLFICGEHVNCRDENDENYHKPDEIKKAAKIRAAKAEKRNDINSDVNSYIQELTDHGEHFYFYDLVASIVITQNDTINLKDWKIELDPEMHLTYIYAFNLNGTNYSTDDMRNFTYDFNHNDKSDRTVYLCYRNGQLWEDKNGLMLKSYVFSDCLWVEQE